MFASKRNFFEGLEHNVSITNRFSLEWYFTRGMVGLFEEIIHNFLNRFNNPKLIVMRGYVIGNGGISVIILTVMKNPHVIGVGFSSSNFNDVMLEELVTGIRGPNHLRRLDLSRNMLDGLSVRTSLTTKTQAQN